jgi:hypothetical protein
LHKGTLRAQNAHPGLLVTMEFPINAVETISPTSKPSATATPVSAA